VTTPSWSPTDYRPQIVAWLRTLADLIEAKQVSVHSIGKPTIQGDKRRPEMLEFKPDLRFLASDVEAAKVFSKLPPGAQS